MIKVVLDTNIIVSAFLAKDGYSSKLLAFGLFDFYTSEPILTEVRLVLDKLRIRKKFNYTDSDINNYIDNIRKAFIFTSGELLTSDLDNRDPDDNIILSCAIEGDVQYIVTRDNDILDLDPYRNIRVVLPDFFYGLLTEEHS